MTSGRSIGSALVLVACCLAMMASTASATIPAAPGGPILVVTPGTSDEFRNYIPEIMRGEGLNDFAAASVSSLSPALLSSYDVVVLSRTTLSDAQAAMLSDWVGAGGNLIAMRPDTRLAGLLGISPLGGATSDDANLSVDTSSAPGAGITSASLQYHGPADRYALAGATSVAGLSSGTPAVTLRSVGAGHAAAFTYDLSRSVVETRQGNPAWAGQERDGDVVGIVRADDMFFGNASSGLPWLDLSRAAVPSADEQQRLLANLITETARTPIPRFWYLPSGNKAAVVLTGDDHGRGSAGDAPSGTAQRFAENVAASAPGCSLVDWQCVRSTSYIYPEVADSTLTATQVQNYEAQGFEVALHLKVDGPNDCSPFSSEPVLNDNYVSQLAALRTAIGNVPAATSRTHCIVWSDFDSQPLAESANGIRLDTNYYYWPGSWIGQNPGLMTGSGFPQRFSALNGSLVDVYQATTQLNDELTGNMDNDLATETNTLNTLLNNAVGASGYYGVFTANNHTDPQEGANHAANVVNAAKAHGVPVISAQQMLTWLDGRNASAFQGVAFNGGQLTFNIAQASGAHGLQAMIPINGSTGALQGLSRNGAAVATSTRTVKGIAYAVFDAQSGSYVATHPVPGAGAGGGSTGAAGTGSTPSKGGTGSTGNSTTSTVQAPTFPKVRVNVKTFRLGGGRVFTVSFKAKKTAKFTLVMTNAKGKVVRTLNAGRKTKGKTVTFKWNGRDKHGKRVSAGTYRFKVTALAGKAKQTVKGSVKVIAPKK
jgi:FlgD Ig-like domain